MDGHWPVLVNRKGPSLGVYKQLTWSALHDRELLQLALCLAGGPAAHQVKLHLILHEQLSSWVLSSLNFFFFFFLCFFTSSFLFMGLRILIPTTATTLLTRQIQESRYRGVNSMVAVHYLTTCLKTPQYVGSAGAHKMPHMVHKVRTGVAWSHIEDNMVSRIQRCPFLLPSPPGPYSSFLVPLILPDDLLGVDNLLGVKDLLGVEDLRGANDPTWH